MAEDLKYLIKKYKDLNMKKNKIDIALADDHALMRDGLKTIITSMYESEFSIIQMFRLGAKGYLEKSCDAKELRLALLTVAKGEFYHSEEISQTILHRMQNSSLSHCMTPRELEFLAYCCSELAYKETADRMNISERTAHSYRDALFEKLELKSRTGLAIYAINAGIISLQE